MLTLTSLLVLGLAAGWFVGFLAGLFGIGGGVVMVPLFTSYFLWQQVAPEVVMQMALATSLSCIVLTSAVSGLTHHFHQAVEWPLVKIMSPAILLGSAGAVLLAVELATQTLAWLFFVLILAVSVLMMLDLSQIKGRLSQLSFVGMSSGGLVIGFVSGLMAIGGGVLSVPFLTLCGHNIRRAIGTAAVLGWPLAVAATLAYVITGLSATNLPNHSLGYVYWPATIVIGLGGILGAPFGAKLTHRLPMHWLRPMFVTLVIAMAARLLWSLL